MSPVSNSPDGNTKLKIEPTAAAAAAESGKIIHLPPSAITMQKGIKNNGNPSIVAQPLVVTAGIGAKIGSSSAIKAEHNDDVDDDKAPGVGTTDTKTPTNAGSISMSFDAIKDDTMYAIEQALNEGKDTEEIQKITKQRKHMWKSILARAGMNKSFKTIWAEVRQYCEEKHRENERAKKCDVNSSSACKSEDDSSSNSVEGAEVAMKSEAEEECNIHVPLKKRKLPSDYVCALSVKFDEVAMSPTLIKKLKIHGGSNDEAAARPDDEEISTTVKIKKEEVEEVVVVVVVVERRILRGLRIRRTEVGRGRRIRIRPRPIVTFLRQLRRSQPRRRQRRNPQLCQRSSEGEWKKIRRERRN